MSRSCFFTLFWREGTYKDSIHFLVIRLKICSTAPRSWLYKNLLYPTPYNSTSSAGWVQIYWAITTMVARCFEVFFWYKLALQTTPYIQELRSNTEVSCACPVSNKTFFQLLLACCQNIRDCLFQHFLTFNNPKCHRYSTQFLGSKKDT
jgi:hypothetical protein